MPAGVRGDCLVNYHHPLLSGRHRPRCREPLGAGVLPRPGGSHHPGAAGAAGGGFPQGFQGAIGIAIFVVAAYLLLNLIVVGVGLYEIATEPQNLANWHGALFSNYGSPLAMLGFSLLVFPQLALGLSGFETGVSMMPLVRGSEGDDPERPVGRIRNTGKLL